MGFRQSHSKTSHRPQRWFSWHQIIQSGEAAMGGVTNQATNSEKRSPASGFAGRQLNTRAFPCAVPILGKFSLSESTDFDWLLAFLGIRKITYDRSWQLLHFVATIQQHSSYVRGLFVGRNSPRPMAVLCNEVRERIENFAAV